eukprot:2516854-Pleurochrysis_carterae.AAC.1
MASSDNKPHTTMAALVKRMYKPMLSPIASNTCKSNGAPRGLGRPNGTFSAKALYWRPSTARGRKESAYSRARAMLGGRSNSVSLLFAIAQSRGP